MFYCPVHYKSISIKIYVDSTFLLLLSELHVTKLLNYTNSKSRNISVTVKGEENNSFSFLDMKFVRDVGKLQPIFSGVLTHLESFLPISYRYNLISTLLHYDFIICSSERTLMMKF